MEINEAYKIMKLRENAPLEEVKRSYFFHIRDFDPDKDRGEFLRVDEAYNFLKTHLKPVNENRKDHLTFKLGEVLRGKI